MRYNRVKAARFLSRSNRFVARVLIDGNEETVHVKNTGRCRELLNEGSVVYLEDFSEETAAGRSARKYRYSLIAVEKPLPRGGTRLINMDSQAPNKVVFEALSQGAIGIAGLDGIAKIKPEAPFGGSRLDFYVEDSKRRGAYIEVKGVTLEENGFAYFPDAPTERGSRHLRELMTAKEQGFAACAVFVIQMSDVKAFAPSDIDEVFAETLRRAARSGVEILCFECNAAPDELKISRKVEAKEIFP